MEENEQQEQQKRLDGTVERIVYGNDTGWTVLDLESEGELYRVVGVLPEVKAGEYLKLLGRWVDHPSFGLQFRAEQCERHLPQGGEAILHYLSSGAVKGIGQATALRIVEKFGDDTLDVLEKEPLRLAELPGISASRAQKIGEEYARQFGLREVMLAFSEYGLSPNEAFRCWKRWGASTIERVRANPYVLCETGLYIGFERADAIRRRMERPDDDPGRMEAGLLYVLRHNLRNGHTCLPENKLLDTAAAMLEVGRPVLEDALERTVAAFAVREEVWDGRRFLFLNHVHRAEKYIASRLAFMLHYPPASAGARAEERIDALEKIWDMAYAAQQREAILQAVRRGILILTGGPGTGKTTTLQAIIAILEQMGQTVAVAAPTGRAAKRLTELTGYEAKTLHRLLEVQWDDEETPVFARNEQNPLEADAVVVDELSMVDSLLFESLLRALKTGCRLILVGDADQLPAVGAGSVLHDLLESGELPSVRLTEVFRQAMKSHIVGNAHRIVAGELPVLNYREGDFFFLPQSSAADVSRTVLELCGMRLPRSYGLSVWNGIQVLCPGRKGELGTREMNRRLQELLNPPAPERREITVEGVTLRMGDKVMHVRNNYDIVWKKDDGETGQGVFNGDIGVLEGINPREGTLSVRYDDRVAVYTGREEMQDIEPAYAVTVHKSQGSEFEAVVLPLFNNSPLLCYRNLLYTAVTRAKSLLILVGSRATVAAMVENDRKTRRYTGLRRFLEDTAGQPAAFPPGFSDEIPRA